MGGQSRHVENAEPHLQAPFLETLGEPRRFSRRVPTSRRALESRPHELHPQHGLRLLTLFCGSFRGYCMLVRAVASLARRAAAMTAWQLLGFSEIFERCQLWYRLNQKRKGEKKKRKKKK